MAAAILMMNMQGAVMAADKDSTIFRYSDKVPFALMVNPNSKLPWADIWNEFRINSDLSESYLTPIEDYLKHILPQYADSITNETIFCVYYEPGGIFPVTHNLEIRIANHQVEINKDDSSLCISSRGNTSYVNWLGQLSHMGTILGDSIIETEDVARSIYPKLVSEFKARALNAVTDETKQAEIELYLDDYELEILLECLLDKPQILLKRNLDAAITSYHIEDMVRMSEKLIDAEAQLEHLKDPQKPLTETKEIATMTLAEGFRWIKHSLYGA